MSDRSPLFEQALSGQHPRVAQLAARGLLAIPPSELLALQVQLAESSDQTLREAALESLRAVDRQILLPVLGHDADAATLAWFARQSRDPQVIEAVLRHRETPAEAIVELAERSDAHLQEILLLRQDLIVERPAILRALERNPALSPYARRRIGEYREHLVAEPGGEQGEATAEGEPGWKDPEIQAALASADTVGVEGEVDDESGLSEGQIRQLPVPLRLKLARGAPRTLRQFLVRDNNPQVALAVIEANPLSDQEIEGIAKSRVVSEDVLERIARERRWAAKYPIVLALVSNPRTPVGSSVKLVPRLSVRDLRNLSRDRNVPEAVRGTAIRLYRVKSQ